MKDESIISRLADIANRECKRHGTPYCCDQYNADLISNLDDFIQDIRHQAIDACAEIAEKCKWVVSSGEGTNFYAGDEIAQRIRSLKDRK